MIQQKIIYENWEKYRDIKIERLKKYQPYYNQHQIETRVFKLIEDKLYKKCPKCNKWLLYDSKYFFIKGQYIDAKHKKIEKRLECYCKKCSSKYKNKQYKNNSNHKYSLYKNGAKLRNLKFALTKNQAKKLFNSPCFYCGYISKTFNGIDRINSNDGYIEGNVVSCCKACNMMKGSIETKKKMKLHKIDFIEHCIRIAEYQKNDKQ